MEVNSDYQNSENSSRSVIHSTQYDNKAFDQNEDEATTIIENAMINRHRDRSKEVSKRIVEDDPSEVMGLFQSFCPQGIAKYHRCECVSVKEGCLPVM